MRVVVTTTKSDLATAREAQKLFFEIGMEHRARVGAALSELGLTFSQAHALRLLDPDRPQPMSMLADRLFCDASNGHRHRRSTRDPPTTRAACRRRR